MAWIATAKGWARRIKRDVLALWLAARDSRTPLTAKLIAGAVAAYALSPVDLIPDFVPVLGYLDDLVIVPVGIMLAIKLIPAPLLEEFRAAATQQIALPASKTGLFIILLIWVLSAVGLLWLFWPRSAA